jgi:DNA-binding Xre family transcriptional regulator
MKNVETINLNSTFTEKVMVGLKKALRKLAEEAALNNENLIIGDKDGNVKSIPAKELLKGISK